MSGRKRTRDGSRVVLCASRRTDLVRWYPEVILKALEERYPPPRVHSIVLLTKFPASILAEPLRSVLARYEQCTAQVTITGWGGTEIEPAVPPAEETLAVLPELLVAMVLSVLQVRAYFLSLFARPQEW